MAERLGESLRRLKARAPRRVLPRFSLRVRLLALAVALVALGLTVSDTLVLGDVRGQQLQRIDAQLQRFGAQQRRFTGDAGHRPFVKDNRRPFLPSQYVATEVERDGHYDALLSQPVEPGDPRPQLPALDAAGLAARFGKPFTVAADHGGGSWRVLIIPRQDGSGGGLVLAFSLDDTDAMLSRLSEGFLWIGGGVLVLICGAGFFAVRAGLRPLRRIEETARQIAAGSELSHRVPDREADARTEVGRLARSLNSMLAQIESAFAARTRSEERMRQFVADAGHELRTPLAGIRGFAELHRMGALAGEGETERVMARIESEAVRMSGLVEDLLTLARLDEQRPLQLAPMDLRTLAADALHDTTALDPSRPIALTGPDGAPQPGAAPVLGDEARLRQVVTNLVGNAVAHTPAGSPIRIGVGTVDGVGVLEVADQGPGLTPEQAARVFERFYRVDASRSRQDRRDGGGAGLGLAIASALTEAHGGRLDLVTAPGEGASFRILLPAVGRTPGRGEGRGAGQAERRAVTGPVAAAASAEVDRSAQSSCAERL